MVSRRRLATLAIVLGLLCLPAPVYVAYGIDATSPDTTQAPYHGPELDPIEGSPTSVELAYSSVEYRVRTTDLVLPASRYDDPDNSSAALRRAIDDGPVTVRDPVVRRDLRTLDSLTTYLHRGQQYYNLSVRANGSTLAVTPVTDAAVVRDTIGDSVVAYDSLDPTAQRAVDNIVANTTAEGWGDYRPHEDNPVVERAPLLVARDGSVYAIYRDGGTYLGPGFAGFVYGGPVTVFGLLLVPAGLLGLYLTRGD